MNIPDAPMRGTLRLIGGCRRTEHHSELGPGSPGLRLERMHASKSSSLKGLVR